MLVNDTGLFVSVIAVTHPLAQCPVILYDTALFLVGKKKGGSNISGHVFLLTGSAAGMESSVTSVEEERSTTHSAHQPPVTH